MTCYLVICNVNIWTNFSFPCLNINPVWKPNLVQSHLSAQVGLVLKPLKVVWTNSLEFPKHLFYKTPAMVIMVVDLMRIKDDL